jgi:orotate phosphoribosyltransferase
MDETTRAIIERVTVTFPKPTRIPTGQVCSIFYDTFQLSPSDLARLAGIAVGHLNHDDFDVAVGLSYSGILYSAAVAGGKKVTILQKDGQFFGPDLKGLKVVVVDDVVHSGGRLRDATQKVQAEGGTVVGYACIVDRSNGNLPGLPLPLWSAFQSEME